MKPVAGGRRIVMRYRTFWWGVTALLVAGWFVKGAAWSRHGGRPLMADPELDALQEAVRWPQPDTQTVVALVKRFIAARRDREAHAYFGELATATPDRPLFLALDGFFQARVATDVSLFRRIGWVNEAVAKLDRAVAREPGITHYFRSLILAELPARFGKAGTALDDLRWVLKHPDRFPIGLRRSVYRGQARAFTTLGRTAEAAIARERSGSPSLDPDLPIFTTDSSVTAAGGFSFRPRRLVELAPRVFVAQGYDF